MIPRLIQFLTVWGVTFASCAKVSGLSSGVCLALGASNVFCMAVPVYAC